MSAGPAVPPAHDASEAARLAALRELALLDAPVEPALDGLARLAARLLGAPTALVTLVDADRQVFAACPGLGGWAGARRHTPLSHSICRHVVRTGAPLVVEDARRHPLLRDSPAIPELGIVAYAGMPLVAADGAVLGGFCVADGEPRAWGPDDLATLAALARSASAELRLRAATRRLARQADEHRDLLAALPLIVYRVEPHPPFAPLYVSPGVRLLGYTHEEWMAVPDTWLRVLHPDDRARVLAETEAALAGGHPVDYEYRVIARDGTVRRVHDHGDFVRDAGGTPTAWQGVMRDVTAEREAQEARERDGAFLAATLHSLSEHVSVCAPDGRLALLNRATLETHGLPADGAVPPERWSDHHRVYLPDGETPLPAEALPHVRVLTTREPALDVEFVVRVPGREPRRLVANAQPMFGAGGEFLGSVCAARDMTAQKAAERALRASEARLQAALDGGRVGFVALRPVRDGAGAIRDFDVVDVNAHAAALCGTPEEELLGQRLGELFPVAHAGGHVARFAAVAGGGAAIDYEAEATDPRVTARWVRVQCVAVTGADGRPDGVALMLRDVSAERTAREELRLLVDVSQALAEAPDVATAAGTALRQMCEAVGFEYGEAWLMSAAGGGGGRVLRHGPVWHTPGDERLAGFARASDGFTFGRGEGLPGQAWARGTPYVVPDLGRAGVAVPRLLHARAAGVRAGAAVPVLAGGEVVAVLAFHTRRPHALEASRVELLAAVAAQVGEVVRARLAEEARRESEARLSLIYESTSDLMFLLRVERDAAGEPCGYRCESVNAAYLELTGLTREQVVGRAAAEGLARGASPALAHYDTAARTGEVLRYEEALDLPIGRLAVETALTPVLDESGTCTHLLGVARDVTEQRALERRLAALSEHDELTGLLNRRGFRRVAEHSIRSAARTGRRDAVLYVDLDRFKPINDAFGHAEGDRALRAVADVLRRTVRDADVCARIGGDEFAIYAVGLQAGDGELIAARLQANLAEHNAEAHAAGRPYRIGLTAGVAELERGDLLDEVLERSDAALYARRQAREGAGAVRA